MSDLYKTYKTVKDVVRTVEKVSKLANKFLPTVKPILDRASSLNLSSIFENKNLSSNSFLAKNVRAQIVSNKNINRILCTGFSKIIVYTNLQYSTFVPIQIKLELIPDPIEKYSLIEISEANYVENSLSIFEKNNSNVENIANFLKMYKCKEIGHGIGCTIPLSSSAEDIIACIANVAECAFAISLFKNNL